MMLLLILNVSDYGMQLRMSIRKRSKSAHRYAVAGSGFAFLAQRKQSERRSGCTYSPFYVAPTELQTAPIKSRVRSLFER
jgi:L-asparaginase II